MELVEGTVLAQRGHCEVTQLLAAASSGTASLPLQLMSVNTTVSFKAEVPAEDLKRSKAVFLGPECH